MAMIHDDAGAFDLWFRGQTASAARALRPVTATGSLVGHSHGKAMHASRPSTMSGRANRSGGLTHSASVPTLASHRSTSQLDMPEVHVQPTPTWGIDEAVPMAKMVSIRVQSISAEAEFMSHRSRDETSSAAQWRAAGMYVRSLSQGGKVDIADIARAAQSKALTRRRRKRWGQNSYTAGSTGVAARTMMGELEKADWQLARVNSSSRALADTWVHTDDDEVFAVLRQGSSSTFGAADRRGSNLASMFASLSAPVETPGQCGAFERGPTDTWDTYQSREAPERAQLEHSLASFSLSLPDYGAASGLQLETREAVLAQRRAEARAASQVFERRHKSAGRRAVTAMRAARDSADMQARADPYFKHALLSIRRNRLGLSGLDAGKEEPPDRSSDGGKLRRPPEEEVISQEIFAADGELARVMSWLTPLLVSDKPADRLRELREARDLLFTERRQLARVFDAYRGKAGLAVGVPQGGMPQTPPAGAEETARQLAASAAPGDAWLLGGAGSSLCRAQWWRMLKESRALGNGLTCSDVDFLVTEAMLLPVIDTRSPYGLYEMDVECMTTWRGRSLGGVVGQGQPEQEPSPATAHAASRAGSLLTLDHAVLSVEGPPTKEVEGAPRLPPREKASDPPADPHDGLATLNFEGFVLAICQLAHTKYRAPPKMPLASKLRSLLRNHIVPAMESAPTIDPIGAELRGPEMSSLMAEHMPMLQLCWEYWNTQHGTKQGWGRMSPKRLAAGAAEDAAVRMSKEVFLMHAEGGAGELLCAENRFNYNELLSMFDRTGLFHGGGSVKPRHIHELFEATTLDRPMFADIHSANERDEIIFDEFVELLVRAAVIKYGPKFRPLEADAAKAALLVVADDFMCDYYTATDRIYPGNLMRVVKQTLGGEPDEPQAIAEMSPRSPTTSGSAGAPADLASRAGTPGSPTSPSLRRRAPGSAMQARRSARRSNARMSLDLQLGDAGTPASTPSPSLRRRALGSPKQARRVARASPSPLEVGAGDGAAPSQRPSTAATSGPYTPGREAGGARSWSVADPRLQGPALARAPSLRGRVMFGEAAMGKSARVGPWTSSADHLRRSLDAMMLISS